MLGMVGDGLVTSSWRASAACGLVFATPVYCFGGFITDDSQRCLQTLPLCATTRCSVPSQWDREGFRSVWPSGDEKASVDAARVSLSHPIIVTLMSILLDGLEGLEAGESSWPLFVGVA